MYSKEIFTTDKENNKREIRMIENKLVPVYETDIGEKVVYGSELHEVLGVRSNYREWIKRRFSDIDAEEDEDYTSVEISTVVGGTPKKDHIIKLDIAKEMAMLERNEKGKQVRRYFIDIEKKYKDRVSDEHISAHHDGNRKPSIAEATETVKLIRSIYTDAGVDPRYIAVTAKCIFKEAGVDIPLPIEMKEDKLYDQTEKAQNVTASKNKTEAAKSKSASYNKSYTTTANLNLRSGAGSNKNIIITIPKGEKVTCYGYYTKTGETVWLYVQYGKYTGFVSKKYLK